MNMRPIHAQRAALAAILLAATVFLPPLTASAREVTVETSAAGAVAPPGATVDNEITSLKRELAAHHGTLADHTRLGFLLLGKGALDEAMASFDEALAQNSRNPEALTGKGIVLARKGDLPQAERVLREALFLNPDPARTHYELGLVYEKQGNTAAAIKEYQNGISTSQQGKTRVLP